MFWSALTESDNKVGVVFIKLIIRIGNCLLYVRFTNTLLFKESLDADGESDDGSEPAVSADPVYEAHVKYPHFQEADDDGGDSDGGGDGDGDDDGDGGDGDGGEDDGRGGDGDDDGDDDGDGDDGVDEVGDDVEEGDRRDSAAASHSTSEHQQGVESSSVTTVNAEAPPPSANPSLQAGSAAGSDEGCANLGGKLLNKEELLQLFLDISQVKGEQHCGVVVLVWSNVPSCYSFWLTVHKTGSPLSEWWVTPTWGRVRPSMPSTRTRRSLCLLPPGRPSISK